jgi:aspartyl-tRNA(Asn)/glutamyl-tRNA(Gln) amidotransferase subunit A
LAPIAANANPVTIDVTIAQYQGPNAFLAMYLTDIYTISCNLAGISGISIPCGFTDNGLPIGLQLQGPQFAESTLLRAARMHEKATDWHTRRPALVG